MKRTGLLHRTVGFVKVLAHLSLFIIALDNL